VTLTPYLFTSANPNYTLLSDVILRRTQSILAPVMRPYTLLRLWHYINPLLTNYRPWCIYPWHSWGIESVTVMSVTVAAAAAVVAMVTWRLCGCCCCCCCCRCYGNVMILSVSVCSDVVISNPYQSRYHSSTHSASLKQLEVENMCISVQQQVDVWHGL